MVILIVKHVSVAIAKLKCHSPVSVDPNRPAALFFTLQWVKVEARDGHIINGLRGIQCHQEHAQTLDMFWLYASRAARFKVFAQSFVSERLNHACRIPRCATRNKYRLTRIRCRNFMRRDHVPVFPASRLICISVLISSSERFTSASMAGMTSAMYFGNLARIDRPSSDP